MRQGGKGGLRKPYPFVLQFLKGLTWRRGEEGTGGMVQGRGYQFDPCQEEPSHFLLQSFA